MRRIIAALSLVMSATFLAVALVANAQSPAPAPGPAANVGDPADIAALYELQSAFHNAASVRDPVNGDTPDVIDARLRAMMALFTPDATLDLMVGGPNDGHYSGTGDPDDATTCPAVSGDVGGSRGTVCTLFKYVAGSFQQKNKFISLAPSYLTHFEVSGDTASVYFQCHYFNVATDPWTVASHLVFDGTATRTNGTWLFSHVNAPVAATIPVPGQTPAPLPSTSANAGTTAMSNVIANC
jgi:hypothetical protein